MTVDGVGLHRFLGVSIEAQEAVAVGADPQEAGAILVDLAHSGFAEAGGMTFLPPVASERSGGAVQSVQPTTLRADPEHPGRR